MSLLFTLFIYLFPYLFFFYLFVFQASALGGPSVLSFIARHLDSVNNENSETNIGKSYLRRNGKKEVLIIAVEENKTAMRVTADSLLNNSDSDSDSDSDSNSNFKSKNSNSLSNNINSELYQNVVYVRSYAECAGVLAAHKAGILLSSITSNVPKIKITRM
jgi:hypothetical protein